MKQPPHQREESQDIQDLSRTSVGRFVIRSRIGAGGMGEVYLAEDTKLKRPVALKRIAQRLRSDDHYRKRLLHEAECASRLSHEHIAGIYDVIEQSGETFLVMEYIEGETLRQRLARPLSFQEFHKVALQCAEALADAHAREVVHGDIKPENIMLTPGGQVKILDFGVAKRLPNQEELSTMDTQSNQTTGFGGTPGYMAPEVLLEKEADGRADIFSLGVVFYEALTGRHPFRAPGFMATSLRILDQTAPAPIRTLNPRTPERLESIVAKMLAKDPERRYATAADLVVDLRSVGDMVSSPRNTQPLITSESKARKRPLVAVVCIILFLVLFAAAGYWFREKQHTRGTTASNPLVRSIAIIPFRNAGAEKAYDYFGVGLADVLNAKLTNARILEVRAVPAPTSFAGSNVDPLQMGRKLRVDAILSGSYQIEEGTLSLRYTLVDLRRDVQVAGKDFQVPFTRAIEAEHELAAEIMDSLQASVSGEERERLTAASTQQNEAFQAYLRSSYEMEVFWSQPSAAQLHRAEQNLDEALRFDPRFTLALVSLARLHWIAAFWGYADDPRILDVAEGQVNKAIEIEPNSGEAYAALALIEFQKAEIDEARKSLRRAFARSPNSALAYYAAGLYYMFKGLPGSVLAFQRAQELNPELIRRELGLAYRSQGDFLRARDQLRQDLEFHPADQVTAAVLAGVLVGLDDIEGARQIERALLHHAPSDPTVQYALALLRVREGADFSIDSWLSRYERVYWADAGYCFDVAAVYAVARQPKPALRWLRRAHELGVTNYPFVSRNPLYGNLLGDSAFQSFLESTRREWEAANRNEQQDPLIP
jgi:serine/threonine protein kinase/tetratricopeptide (TPR) repeat protein